MAVLKALPTDTEIERAPSDVNDAGIYMKQLALQDEAAYQQMLRTRRTAWGGPPDQPMERCVDHLIALIIRAIEEDTAGRDDLKVTEAEMDAWCRAHGFEH